MISKGNIMKLRYTMVVEEDLDYDFYDTKDPVEILEKERINCEKSDSWLFNKFSCDNYIFSVDLRTEEGFLLSISEDEYDVIYEFLQKKFDLPKIIHKYTFLKTMLDQFKNIPGVLEDILHAANIEKLKEQD